MDLQKLAEPFPRNEVEWRAQGLTQDKKKAMALAYIDARAVMNKLDEVCGPQGWQSSFTETPRGRVVCSIAIKIGDEWVSKSDGAGDTAVEGEKGAISDALKRAAVHWGIGRYLYAMDAVWVPCEIGRNGKFRKFTADPWNFVRNGGPRPPDTSERAPKPDNQPDPAAYASMLKGKANAAADMAKLNSVWDANRSGLAKLEGMNAEMHRSVCDVFTQRRADLAQAPDTRPLSERAAADAPLDNDPPF